MRESKGVYTEEANCWSCGLNCMIACGGYGKLPDGSYTYGKLPEELVEIFPNGCDDWEITLGGMEEWMSDANLRYNTAVKLYIFLIDYAKNHEIDSLSELIGAIEKDETIDKYERMMYVTRIRTMTPKVKKIFK